MAELKENPYYNFEETLANFKKITEYTPVFFEDRIVENPWTFEVDDLGRNPVTGKDIVHLDFREGEVVEEGTDLSEKNLGNLDIALAVLYKWRSHIDQTLLQLILKTDGLEMTTLNGMVANAYGVTFDDLDSIKINKGYYDEARGEVWS